MSISPILDEISFRHREIVISSKLPVYHSFFFCALAELRKSFDSFQVKTLCSISTPDMMFCRINTELVSQFPRLGYNPDTVASSGEVDKYSSRLTWVAPP